LDGDGRCEAIAYRDFPTNLSLASAHVLRPRLFPWALLHPGRAVARRGRRRFLMRTHAPQPGDLLPIIRAQAPWILGSPMTLYRPVLEGDRGHAATATIPAGTVTYDVRNMESGKSDAATPTANPPTALPSPRPRSAASPSRGSRSPPDLQKPLTRL